MQEAYVTGARGFLGSHLVEKLDDFTAIPHEEIDDIALDTYKKFFFLSTYGNIAGHDVNDDYMVMKANIIDLLTILGRTDFGNGPLSFIYTSSSSVIRKIQTPYSRAKKAAEEILLAYMEKYNAPIAIVRPLSITGVGDQKEHLIPTLIRSCLDGEDMPFVPDAVHDYIDVEDVVDGLLTLSKRHAKGIFELGTGVSHTNQEVKTIVETVTGEKANIHEVKNLRAYDSDEWVSKNFQARTYGWEPKKQLYQSVQEMVGDYEQARKKSN